MIKKNFLYKSGLENKLSSIGAGLFVVCLCLLSGSCDSNSFPGDDYGSDTDPITLQFSTSVEKLLSTAGTRAIKPGGVIEGPTFPQGENRIGMFITRNSSLDSNVFPGSADNMKAVLTRKADGTESWAYTQKNGTTPTIPKSYVGKNIQVVAYWPYNQDATASGIPFDFTNVTGGVQTELLYNKQERQKIKIAARGQIPLEFAHAYSWITLNIRKSVDLGDIKVTSASVVNQSGAWIKNKGMINPATGYPTEDSQPGDIIDANTRTLTIFPLGAKYEFLVPAFIDELVTDGSVGFKLLVEGKETIFELKREHLNKFVENGITKYGFCQGYKNSYELVHDNLTMSLQLRSWTVVKPEGDVGLPGIADPNYKGWMFDYKDINKDFLVEPEPISGSKPLEITTKPVSTHIYETYLSDLDRGNNGNIVAFWLPDSYTMFWRFKWVWDQEPPRSPIEFAINDVLTTPSQWRNQDGILVARELCKNYREGGYSNWRLPRMAEWYMFEKRIKTSNGYLYYPQQYGGKIPGQSWYWSGTESQKTGVQVIKLTISQNDINIEGNVLPAINKAMVRCVRDTDSGTN